MTFTLATVELTRDSGSARRTRPRVVHALAASFGLISVTGGIGLATLVGWAADGWIAWLVAPFAASSVYLLLSALEVVLARRIADRAELELQRKGTD